MTFRRSSRGRQDLPEVQEGSGGPPAVPTGVSWTSRKSGRGREAHSEVLETLPEFREGSEVPFRGPRGPRRGLGRVWRTICSSDRGRDALPNVWEALP